MPEKTIRCIIGDDLYLEILLTAMVRMKETVALDDFWVAGPEEPRRKELRDRYKIHTTGDLQAAVEKSSLLVIAIHEAASARKLMEQIQGKLPPETPVISLADRVKTGELEQYFPGNPVIRMALNPSIVSGSGVGTFITGGTASQDAAMFARMILSGLGREVPVSSEEELEKVRDIIYIESVYSYLALKALVEAGVKAGLSEMQSKYIAGQVTAGTLKTLLNPDEKTLHVMKKGESAREAINQAKQLGRSYGFQEIMEKAMAMQ